MDQSLRHQPRTLKQHVRQVSFDAITLAPLVFSEDFTHIYIIFAEENKACGCGDAAVSETKSPPEASSYAEAAKHAIKPEDSYNKR